MREEEVVLKHESDFGTPALRSCGFVQLRPIFTQKLDGSFVGDIQAAHKVKECTFSCARRANDRQLVPWIDG